MHLARSLRIRVGILACAAVSLGLVTACGATPQAQPTASAPSPGTAAPAAAASPQRPPLASPAAAASPSPAAQVSSSPTTGGPEQTYEVKSGDTLLSIAQQFYGDATLWRRIYDANRDVIGNDPDQLKLEQKLRIPPKE